MKGPFDDADLEDCMAGAVQRGEFASLDEARADFLAKLDESIAQAGRGETTDAAVVFARLQQRYADWPHAAE